MLLPLNSAFALPEELLVEKTFVDLLGLGVGDVGLEIERRLDGADDAGLLVGMNLGELPRAVIYAILDRHAHCHERIDRNCRASRELLVFRVGHLDQQRA